MMQALQLLQLAKVISHDKATLNDEEIKLVTLVIISYLKALFSYLVGWLVI